MNRLEILKFYDKEIKEIENEEIRDNLLYDLDEIDDMLEHIEKVIEEEMEKQETEEIIFEQLENEFNYANRLPPR